MKVTLEHQPETYGRGCWMVDIVSDDPEVGSMSSMHFTGRAHAGSYRKGAEAYLRGENRNPYGWDRGSGLGMLGRRGFRNAWQAGWTTAQSLDRSPRRARAPESEAPIRVPHRCLDPHCAQCATDDGL